MSEQVLSFGIMVSIKEPITDQAKMEEFVELLDKKQSIVHINYEGTILYTDHGSVEASYGGVYINCEHDDLVEIYTAIQDTTLIHLVVGWRSYCCSWYNGTDSHMATMTLKEFNKTKDYLI